MSVKPDLVFDVRWVGHTYGRKNRRQAMNV